MKMSTHPEPASTVFIFGPQALSFHQDSFIKLRNQLHQPGNQWALDTIAGLSSFWLALVKDVSVLHHVEGQTLLEELATAIDTGELGKLHFPLSSILLSPLVVITELTQYVAFLKAGLPGLADKDELPSILLERTEVLGLCIGMLAGIAVNCSSSLSQLQHHGANAVRLAMLVGALIDAEQASPDSEGNATSFSVSWAGTETNATLEKVLAEFPEAYESVRVDKKRSTITASKRTASVLVKKLKSDGLHVIDVALSGRFHWNGHQADVAKLIQFCESNLEFQFPAVGNLALSHRAKGTYAPTDRLHKIALDAILTNKSQWLGLFIFCIGQERCIPTTIARKLGSRLIHISQIDLSTSSIPLSTFGSRHIPKIPDDHIAVIGMSCHVPGGSDLSEFWDVLASGQSQHVEVPSSRFGMGTAWRDMEKGRKWYGNFINNQDTFDHKFFKKSPREMASTDPQHRIILQLAASNEAMDKHIGCYIGIGNVEYGRNIACHPANAYSATGNLRSFVAGKVSHYFGWTGPSLVAIHNACRAILHGECSAALAGGVNVMTNPDCPTGQCKPFDAKGDGYCRAEGGGVVFLKRLFNALADGDQNQNCTAITVPNAISLSELFKDVVLQAKLEPQDVSVVEAHGTGTPVGDSAEYDGIRHKLSLTSVKGSVGHAEFASGVLALLKILLMIDAKAIPPQASFSSLSPGLKSTPEDNIEIPTRLKPWDVKFRAALINNYGASGSNVSLVVTEAPALGSWARSPQSTSAKSFPFWFSGFNDQSLRAYHRTNKLKDLSAANLSFQVSRQSNRTLPQALILSASSSDELEQKLAAFERGDKSVPSILQQPARPVILCFGGQISTHVGLDKDVYNHVAILQHCLDKCNAVCLSLGLDGIYPHVFQKFPIEDIVVLQTTLFAMQYSCARAWIDCGLKVAAVVGHSFGELTALCVAGVYSLEDALRLISRRAGLIRENWGADKGSMLAVEADLADISVLLNKSNQAAGDLGTVSIACYNGPRTFTLAGPAKAIQAMEQIAKKDPSFSKIRMKKLNVTNAFHSTLVEALVDDLMAVGQEVTFTTPTIRVERATEQASSREAIESSYPAKHMREPVFFNHAVQRLAKEFPAAVWLEAGSNSTVTTMASRALGNPSCSHFQSINITSDGSFQFIADGTCKLWKEGLNVSFWAHHAKQVSEYKPILLPPYQFEKSRHWMELKDPPRVEASMVEDIVQGEAPKGLTIFLGYQDKKQRIARFQVNTTIDKFQRPVQANIVVSMAAVTPGMLQLQIALDALNTLRPDLKDQGFQPQLRSMSHHKALVADSFKALYLNAANTDEAGLVWEWKLSATDLAGDTSNYTTGTIIFRPASDPELRETCQSLTRLSGRKRCVNLLGSSSADDVLSGQNIYRAFEQVVNYKHPYRQLTKIAARDGESAGRVVKSYEGQAWIDPVLTECFCQVAGIYINLMTDTAELSERGIFVCDRIDRWIRNPRLNVSSSLPEDWEVFAVHHHDSETKYISDVFAFDPRDGSLVEAVLGISYQRVSIDGMRKALSRSGTQSEAHLTNGHTAPRPIPAPVQAPKRSTATLAPEAVPVKKSKKTRTAPKSPRPDVAVKTIEIVCNLSGLEPEEIKDDSDLVEIGIDSLMAMELVREVEHAFKYTLSTDQLMTLTDFKSLVDCIRSCLGLEGQDTSDASAEEEEEETMPRTNGFRPQTNTVHGVHGVNDVNAYNSCKEINGTNGVHEINGQLTPPKEVDGGLPTSIVRDTFGEVKWATDHFIVNGKLDTYVNEVIPRSTELCIIYIINAFEELGYPIRSAAPGQQLERVHLPKHQKFIDLIYNQLLKDEARLIEINGSVVTRTAVAAPTQSPETLLEVLVRDEPVHAAEHQLMGLIGPKFADCLTGKLDCLQIMFGTPTGREIVTRMYAKSPITGIWIQQLEHFLELLVEKRPRDGQPLCILEMGAGTGGTTSRLVPMLARLGVPIKYTMTDISGGLVAAARKRFKTYPFMKFEVLNIETEPAAKLLESQHIILATNCVHATRDLSISLKNIHQILRPDGFLMLLEMTEQVPWVDFIFGLVEGWWLFEDDRDYVLQPPQHWEKKLYAAGFGHVDWTEGRLPEARIQRLIVAHASGPRCGRGLETNVPPTPPAHDALTEIIERQTVIDAYIDKYSNDFRPPSPTPSMASASQLPSKRCVLVTGATGSLGSHIVAYLAQFPEVDTVVCLNRLSTEDADDRQRKSLGIRGIKLDPVSESKLDVMSTDTSKPLLGFSLDRYRKLVHTVTDIVHSAWPMSLTRPVRAYESQFKVFRNLVEFAREAADHRPASFKFGFQFISSLAVVANYPQITGNAMVPEQSTTVESVPAAGYADAKLVCEHILHKTLHAHRDRFHPMVVRIAQISGSTSNGYWNPTEYMPFLVKSSQVLRILPDLSGTLSWYPVNSVAATLGEILMSSNAASNRLTYHIDNPSRQPWKEMIANLAQALDIPSAGIVPYEEWVDQVKRFGGSTTDNPALQLIDFFDHYFVPMSCGGLMLDTTNTRELSKTLRTMGPVGKELVVKYVTAWKESGFLNP
ncbi:putative polyketide synthase [Delitschia confertaspora ATCC 74209]|uniref:Polyketide synthase n=1 Tax=Delitschia confertaspora ATCC 74209 TaxID=1513339 RepID=A0A9P4JJV8_9PLEO|nr:putative polyketide synthase [Delitschia confertaspora ATCC 74209]